MPGLSKRDVPVAALRFDSQPLQFAENADGGGDRKRAPIRMLARSGKPIEHGFWGQVVHDMDGMILRKQRIPLDWCHWEQDAVGYADSFTVENGDLIVSGELVSVRDDDTAGVIIDRGRAGIPYEASIDFNGPGLVVEELAAGESATVNGHDVHGPAAIIRQWSLRSVAVCPHGADHNARSEFSATDDGTIAVTITTKGANRMDAKLLKAINTAVAKFAKTKKRAKAKVVAELAAAAGVSVKEMTAVLAGKGSTVSAGTATKRLSAWSKFLNVDFRKFADTDDEEMDGEGTDDEEMDGEGDDEQLTDDEEMDGEDDDDEQLTDDEEMDGEGDDDEQLEGDDEQQYRGGKRRSQQLSAERKFLAKLVKRFGQPLGMKAFTQGWSYSATLEKHADRLEKKLRAAIAETEKLKNKLSAIDDGDETPASFSSPESGKQRAQKALENKLGSAGAAKFAAGIKLPGRK